MKKYSVYFHSITHGELDRSSIDADSFDDAYQKYIVGKDSNNFESVVVSPFGWLDYAISGNRSFKNPLYKPVEKPKAPDNHKQTSESENDISNSFYATSSVTKAHSEKLDKLIELQEKQLYWIRIIGIPFLFAAIGTFLTLLIRVFK